MERSMGRLWRDFDRLSPFGALRHRLFDPHFRTVPVETTADGQRLYKISLDLGSEFRPEDITVTVKDREVTVKARRESTADGCKQLREYSYQYSLPEEVTVEQIRSLLTSDGQLTVEAPLPALKEPPVTEIPVQKGDK
jgi:HSP20 family molecular chaperone IbpA